MTKIKLSVMRKLRKEFGSDWREIVELMLSDDDDFTLGKYRFIHSGSIDQIMLRELENDNYKLGRIDSAAISVATGWPEFLIELAQQDNDAHDELGSFMTKEHIIELIENHLDYGEHFADHDSETNYFGDYLVFRIR